MWIVKFWSWLWANRKTIKEIAIEIVQIMERIKEAVREGKPQQTETVVPGKWSEILTAELRMLLGKKLKKAQLATQEDIGLALPVAVSTLKNYDKIGQNEKFKEVATNMLMDYSATITETVAADVIENAYLTMKGRTEAVTPEIDMTDKVKSDRIVMAVVIFLITLASFASAQTKPDTSKAELSAKIGSISIAGTTQGVYDIGGIPIQTRTFRADYTFYTTDNIVPLITVSDKDPKTGQYKVWINKKRVVWTSDSTFILKTK